jgi:N6-L-threonylcarbamoyladenine synthase
MIILGIESSCDDCSAAIYDEDKGLLSQIVSSQDEIHAKYGGVVPELASRNHIQVITIVVKEALEQAGIELREIGGIAVTHGPGLIGSLLVGLSFAKSIAFGLGIPFVGIDHLDGHLYAIFLEKDAPSFPYLGLVVSGGHSNLYVVRDFKDHEIIGRTLDDAPGEAFDKIANLLGLGYPGGAVIERVARAGDKDAIKFTRPLRGRPGYNFSFSGLKTGVVTHYDKKGRSLSDAELANLCASFQETVVDSLVEQFIKAAKDYEIGSLVLSGGVAANTRLREKLQDAASEFGYQVFHPRGVFCTDNAAMIARLGIKMLKAGASSPLDLNAYARR